MKNASQNLKEQLMHFQHSIQAPFCSLSTVTLCSTRVVTFLIQVLASHNLTEFLRPNDL